MKFLSIDNDFFPWYGLDGKFRVKNAQGEWHDDVPGTLVFDWGHSESRLYIDALWPIRKMGFHEMGLDLEREFNVREEYGGVRYSTFAERILERFTILGPVLIADSHMHAYEAMHIGPGEWDEVVHFDAHHDLGYGSQDEHAREEVLDCGDWLYHALRLGLTEKVTVVYPEWREEERPGKWTEPYGDQITWTSWDEWLWTSAKEDQGLAFAYSCRSGAWAPPYLDSKWLGMCRRLGGRPPRAIKEDGCDQPRPWDEDDAKTSADRERQAG